MSWISPLRNDHDLGQTLRLVAPLAVCSRDPHNEVATFKRLLLILYFQYRASFKHHGELVRNRRSGVFPRQPSRPDVTMEARNSGALESEASEAISARDQSNAI
jgi:hypothetical protein